MSHTSLTTLNRTFPSWRRLEPPSSSSRSRWSAHICSQWSTQWTESSEKSLSLTKFSTRHSAAATCILRDRPSGSLTTSCRSRTRSSTMMSSLRAMTNTLSSTRGRRKSGLTQLSQSWQSNVRPILSSKSFSKRTLISCKAIPPDHLSTPWIRRSSSSAPRRWCPPSPRTLQAST